MKCYHCDAPLNEAVDLWRHRKSGNCTSNGRLGANPQKRSETKPPFAPRLSTQADTQALESGSESAILKATRAWNRAIEATDHHSETCKPCDELNSDGEHCPCVVAEVFHKNELTAIGRYIRVGGRLPVSRRIKDLRRRDSEDLHPGRRKGHPRSRRDRVLGGISGGRFQSGAL